MSEAMESACDRAVAVPKDAVPTAVTAVESSGMTSLMLIARGGRQAAVGVRSGMCTTTACADTTRVATRMMPSPRL